MLQGYKCGYDTSNVAQILEKWLEDYNYASKTIKSVKVYKRVLIPHNCAHNLTNITFKIFNQSLLQINTNKTLQSSLVYQWSNIFNNEDLFM